MKRAAFTFSPHPLYALVGGALLHYLGDTDTKGLAFMSFLAPQFLWLLLALPAVVALHFIRSRRKRLDVSALFLWQQAAQLAERRRRFSPTWLLALQLLFVGLAAFALAQPSFSVGGAPERILIFDASASMAARQGDSTRLERAKADAADLLAGAGRVAVIRAGLDATVAQPLSSDRGEVRRALQGLTAADASADLQRALDLAASVAPSAELHLFGDDLAGVAPPPERALTFHPLAQPGANESAAPSRDTEQGATNWGISAFDLRNQQIFVSVVSSARRPQEVTLSVTRDDGAPIAQTSLLVPSRGQANTSFPAEEMTGFYRATISVPAEDALTLDNEAFAGSRTLNVVVTPPSPRLERALRILPGVNVRSVQALQEGTTYDVLISSDPPPETLAPGRYLFFRPPSGAPRYGQIADWDRSDPLLRFVDLTGVTVGLPPEGEAEPSLPAGDWRTLAQTGDLSPAILRLSEPGVEAALLRFHPSQTDLVRRVAFPILMANLIDTFRGEPRLPLGAPLPQAASNEDIGRATEPGVYTVGGAPYSVSLLSAAESRLETSLPSVADTQSTADEAEATTERSRNLGLWLTLLALLVLVGEWLLWSRGGGGGWARA